MNLQDRFDELDNIENTLRILIDEITDKNYKKQFQEIMNEAQTEKEELEPQLQEEYEQEEQKRNIDFERSRL